MNKILRFIIELYRNILYAIFAKEKNGYLTHFVECRVTKAGNALYFGDVVHPCIRKSSFDFFGHNYWMVYTPYYEANSDIENPLLCYNLNTKLTDWNIYDEVSEKHSQGYNSDPNLIFDNNKCYVYWREYNTHRNIQNESSKAVYLKIYSQDGTSEIIDIPLLKEKSEFEDRLVSPSFIKFGNKYRAYAMHLRFKNPKLFFKNKTLNNIINIILQLSAVLNIYNQQKCYGISIWESTQLDKPFTYIGTTEIKKRNKLYIPWHLDLFEYNNKLYSLIQTNQCNADIVLAESLDYETFRIFPKPLITSKDIKKIGIYKPTAVVEGSNLCIYFTAQDENNRKLNKMYLAKCNINELIDNIS